MDSLAHLLVDAAVRAAVSSGASCKVISAITAAAVRSAMAMIHNPVISLGDSELQEKTSLDVAGRLRALAKPLAAQAVASTLSGQNHHSASGLLSASEVQRGNAARHVAFDSSRPFGVSQIFGVLSAVAIGVILVLLDTHRSLRPRRRCGPLLHHLSRPTRRRAGVPWLIESYVLPITQSIQISGDIR